MKHLFLFFLLLTMPLYSTDDANSTPATNPIMQTIDVIYKITQIINTVFTWIQPSHNTETQANSIDASSERMVRSIKAEKELNECVHQQLYDAAVIIEGKPLEHDTLPAPCDAIGTEYELLYGTESLSKKKKIYTSGFNQQLRRKQEEAGEL